jgi:D-lactate dehydrogenase (cytochrome)
MAEPKIVARLKALLGPQGYRDDPAAIAPHLVEQRGLYHGATTLVVRPRDTDQVAAVVDLCRAVGIPVVPQGGNTGLSGGGVPSEDGYNIILSLERLNRVRAIDAENYSLVAEAGCILAAIQQVARDHDRLFPLSLGAEGSCQIGGNISTNAGGVQVLRYGNMRELVLGLEVVLPDGRVWNGLRSLRKDNTGYDLKQLFIGAEGTLGIVTAASLRLFPLPLEAATALVAVADPAAAMALFNRARAATNDQLSAFELIPRIGLDFAVRHIAGCVDPLPQRYPNYVLIELTSSSPQAGLDPILEAFLASQLETGLVLDAVIAKNRGEARDLWRLREGLVLAQRNEGGSIKHDVSVPVSAIPAFIAEATAAVEARLPGIRPVPFGHIGDGNVHFNLSQPVGADTAAYLARWGEFNRIVHDIVARHRGSISAEHGVGRLRRDELARYKSPIELELMRRIKAAFDPDELMNPGKIIPETPD